MKYHNMVGYVKTAWLMALCIVLMSGCGNAGLKETGAYSEYTEESSKDTENLTDGQTDVAADDDIYGETGRAADDENSGNGADMLERLDSSETGRAALESLIMDAGVRERVWYTAGLTEEDTLEEILQKLDQCESLILEQQGRGSEAICSLNDLYLLPNLRNLVIDLDSWDSSEIKDFTPIASLLGLEELYLHYEKDEEIDLSFLSGMRTVTDLFLPNCSIRDLSFLKEMTWLERLSLYQTPVEDCRVLENLTGLVELNLAGNAEAAHIEAVGRLTNIQDLGLQDCGIYDIDFLKGLTALRQINLNGNFVSDLSPLKNLSGLERLGLAGNRIRDISVLAGLPELFDLALDQNEITDISALSGLSRLNQVGLSDNQIVDITPLSDKEELIYVSIFGNPCADLTPVLSVPMLNIMSRGELSDAEAETVARFMEELYPEAEEFLCVDYVEGDLDGNGLTDIAFVVEGEFEGADSDIMDNRRLYILMQEKDGTFRPLQDLPRIAASDSGGTRGDPYRGIFIGNGYFVKKSEAGSREGTAVTDVYRYHGETLEWVMRTGVSDDYFAWGYDVMVQTEDDWYRYVIAYEGYRMVRVDLENAEYPAHRAFPMIDLYDGSFVLYPEKRQTRMSPDAVLELFRQDMAEDAVLTGLSYAPWQKENYELLTGVELPDCYYVIPDAEDDSSDCIFYNRFFYNGLTVNEGEYYHRIYFVDNGIPQNYLVHDGTGEISEERW